MNTLENLQSIKIIIKNRPNIFAERVSDTVWEVSRGADTRKDRTTEKALAEWIREAGFRYEVIKLRPQKVTLGIDVDELNEKLMQLFVTAGMLRSMGIDLRDVASPAEPAAASNAPTPPDSVYTIKLSPDISYIAGTGVTSLEQVSNYSFRVAKCNCETCRNIMIIKNPDFDMIEAAKSVSILNSNVRFTRSTLTESFVDTKDTGHTVEKVRAACRGQRVQIEMFPKQEYYDLLAQRYGRLVGDLQESARIAEDLQQRMQEQREHYTTLDARRAALYEKMKRLG